MINYKDNFQNIYNHSYQLTKCTSSEWKYTCEPFNEDHLKLYTSGSPQKSQALDQHCTIQSVRTQPDKGPRAQKVKCFIYINDYY